MFLLYKFCKTEIASFVLGSSVSDSLMGGLLDSS